MPTLEGPKPELPTLISTLKEPVKKKKFRSKSEKIVKCPLPITFHVFGSWNFIKGREARGSDCWSGKSEIRGSGTITRGSRNIISGNSPEVELELDKVPKIIFSSRNWPEKQYIILFKIPVVDELVFQLFPISYVFFRFPPVLLHISFQSQLIFFFQSLIMPSSFQPLLLESQSFHSLHLQLSYLHPPVLLFHRLSLAELAKNTAFLLSL